MDEWKKGGSELQRGSDVYMEGGREPQRQTRRDRVEVGREGEGKEGVRAEEDGNDVYRSARRTYGETR